MSLVKTDRGREALLRREPSLSPRERQIIVLANGKLSRAALAQLMQQAIDVEIDRLIQCGYLVQELASAIGAGIAPMPTPVQVVPTRVESAPTIRVPDAPIVPRTQSGSRRSLAGTKMYIMDMLQLMRNMEASSMAVTVHTSQSEMDFIYNVIVAVRFIADNSGVSYGMRVVGKLKEIVPEAHLPAVEALELELEAGAVEA